MANTLRLMAALLASLALPALAQTPAPATTPGRPAATAPTTATPAPRAATPAANAPAAIPPGTVPNATAARPATTTPASPAAPSATSAATAARTSVPAATANKIDINSANETQLDTLPGVGPVRAKAIVSGRPWDDLNDLVKKNVIPQAVLDGNRARLALANINTSSAADLAKTLPGIGDARARAIVNGRPYATPQDLVTKKVLTPGVYDKMKDLVAY